jgi:mRNA interferase YafQ
MRIVQPTSFKKDIKRQKKRGKDLDKLKTLIELLVSESDLPESYRDHALSGNWIGWRDCHIEPDWILIYKLTPEALTLGRTGSHSDLF